MVTAINQTQSTKSRDGYLAVQRDLESHGLITYWRIKGGTNPERLAEAWEREGLITRNLPNLPSEVVALRRACQEVGRKHQLMARGLGKPGSWALVRESVSDERWEGFMELRVERNTEGGGLAFEAGALHSLPDETLAQVTAAIQVAYARCQDELEREMASWLVKQAMRLQALRLRDTGGVYYIPEEHVAEWDQIATAVQSVTAHHIFRIPALKTEHAIEALVEALVEEANGAVAHLEEELMKPELGERALRTRQLTAEGVSRKVARYEELLGVSLREVSERMVDLESRIGQAILLRSQED